MNWRYGCIIGFKIHEGVSSSDTLVEFDVGYESLVSLLTLFLGPKIITDMLLEVFNAFRPPFCASGLSIHDHPCLCYSHLHE